MKRQEALKKLMAFRYLLGLNGLSWPIDSADRDMFIEAIDTVFDTEGARLDEGPVLKTGAGNTVGGSSPSPSAK